jgi:ribonuclease BN (tRNA processing enzyme)
MQAKHVLLTHFSQRLPKFVSVPVTGESSCVIGVASDLLQVHMKDFAKLAVLNNSSLTSFFGLEQEEGLELSEEAA